MVVNEQHETEARDLRIEISELNESRKALKGIAGLGDEWARMRLGQVEAAITERMGRLTTLALDGKEAANG